MNINAKLKQKNIFNKYVIFVVIFLLLLAILIYCFNSKLFSNAAKQTSQDANITQDLKDNEVKKSDYVYLKDRETYVIQNVDENFLNNYYGNENTMVVFSASWCKYCVQEQNELNNFIINNPDKKVIIVSHDKTYEDLEKYLKDNNFNWYVILDTNKTIREHIDPGTKGIPCAYLLNKDGKIIGFKKGMSTESEFLQFYNNEINIY